ncbi:MAG: hypothetical protein IPN85_18670 [Flavobacteriales bacterium]|nr:hypothetical protein [Flavobacteriales bacterium]
MPTGRPDRLPNKHNDLRRGGDRREQLRGQRQCDRDGEFAGERWRRWIDHRVQSSFPFSIKTSHGHAGCGWHVDSFWHPTPGQGGGPSHIVSATPCGPNDAAVP